MNYLAHALLSPDHPYVLMGNLWGDLLKPRDYESLPPLIRKGISLHKEIDRFTDSHVHVKQLMHLLRPHQGKYTPVVADVLMDFMLSKYWNEFHDSGLEGFCKKKYILVSEHLSILPDRLHDRINRMLNNRWLESCLNVERMEQTLRMLSLRASFANQIPESLAVYHAHQEQMDSLFLIFFRELCDHINLQS